MSVVAEVLGVGHEIEHRGRTYKIGLITQRVKAEFEQKLFARAKDAARGLRDLMDKEEYHSHLLRLNHDYLHGEYGLESKRGQKHLTKWAGVALLLSLLCGCDESEALILVKEKEEEMVPLIRQVLKESYGLTDEELNSVSTAKPGKPAKKKVK